MRTIAPLAAVIAVVIVSDRTVQGTVDEEPHVHESSTTENQPILHDLRTAPIGHQGRARATAHYRRRAKGRLGIRA